MTTTIAEQLLLLIAGAGLTLIGAIVKTRLDRRTHFSTRIFELRIEALNQVWQAFNEMKGLYASRFEVGFPRWKDEYRQQAGEALTRFRRAIDNTQVILPAAVIEILRKIDLEYHRYHRSEDINHRCEDIDVMFHGKVENLLQQLTTVVNETMSKQTHEINLRLRT